jgi:hypothetical protein
MPFLVFRAVEVLISECIVQFGEILGFGKKPSLLGGLEQAQYVKVIYSGSPASRKAPYSRSLSSEPLYRRPNFHDEREKVGLSLRYC